MKEPLHLPFPDTPAFLSQLAHHLACQHAIRQMRIIAKDDATFIKLRKLCNSLHIPEGFFLQMLAAGFDYKNESHLEAVNSGMPIEIFLDQIHSI